MQTRYQYLIMAVLLATVFSISIHRDIRIEKQYTVDLRNRVVGARLQMDGKLPYFYKWQPADGLRYYDPIKLNIIHANSITASPFYHHLLYPIANFPQREISKIWLVAEYLMYILCIVMALSFTKNLYQKWGVIIVSSMFIFTEGWKIHISTGQNYIVFAFLAFVFFYFFRKKDNFIFSFLAGLASIVLVLSRPTAIIFFLPFIFLLKKYSARYLIVFFIPVMLIAGYSLINNNERSYWLDYREAISAHIVFHQSSKVSKKKEADQPVQYATWEGWNTESIKQAKANHPISWVLEYANIQNLILIAFGKKIPYQIMEAANVFLIVVLMIALYFRQKRSRNLDISVFAIFGFCLYMMSGFFSPIFRTQYQTVQWIFPVFVMAAFYNHRLRGVYLLILLGILLNISNSPMIKMRHTLGEFLILFPLLWMCLSARAKFLK